MIGNFKKHKIEYIVLKNTTELPMAFKVKTTAPKSYCVRPNASILEPGSSVEISVILQAFSDPLPKNYKCKDKFLLVSLPCPDLTDASKVGDMWSDLEDRYKDSIVLKKLRVNYTIFAEEVAEKKKQSPSSNNGVKKLVKKTVFDIDATKENKLPEVGLEDQISLKDQFKDQSNTANIMNSGINKNNSPHALKKDENRPFYSKKNKIACKDTIRGISFPFAFILVILAFLIGWLFF